MSVGKKGIAEANRGDVSRGGQSERKDPGGTRKGQTSSEGSRRAEVVGDKIDKR